MHPLIIPKSVSHLYRITLNESYTLQKIIPVLLARAVINDKRFIMWRRKKYID